MNIHVTQPCPACQGQQKQLHPLWLELFQRREKESELKAADFFREHRIPTVAGRPHLVIPCRKCSGTGEVTTWVPLQRFLERARQAGLGLYKFLGGAPL